MYCNKCHKNYIENQQEIGVYYNPEEVVLILCCSCGNDTVKIIKTSPDKDIEYITIIKKPKEIASYVDKVEQSSNYLFFDNSELQVNTVTLKDASQGFIDSELTTSLCYYNSVNSTTQQEYTTRGFKTDKKPFESPVQISYLT